jgi:hypothetical protein
LLDKSQVAKEFVVDLKQYNMRNATFEGIKIIIYVWTL